MPRGLELALASRRGSASFTGVASDWLKDASLVFAGAKASVDVDDVADGIVDGIVDVRTVVCVLLLEIELVEGRVVAAGGVEDAEIFVSGL